MGTEATDLKMAVLGYFEHILQKIAASTAIQNTIIAFKIVLSFKLLNYFLLANEWFNRVTMLMKQPSKFFFIFSEHIKLF